MPFIETDPLQLQGNVIDTIANQWMLLSAGTEGAFNFMTANWGMMGEIWSHPAVTVYVRQSRHTKRFMDKNDRFSLTVLKDGYRKALQTAGSVSGRDVDKVRKTGLTPLFLDGLPTFAEASRVLLCKKLYCDTLDEDRFFDTTVFDRCYPHKDLHTMYIARIECAYVASPRVEEKP